MLSNNFFLCALKNSLTTTTNWMYQKKILTGDTKKKNTISIDQISSLIQRIYTFKEIFESFVWVNNCKQNQNVIVYSMFSVKTENRGSKLKLKLCFSFVNFFNFYTVKPQVVQHWFILYSSNRKYLCDRKNKNYGIFKYGNLK